MKTVALMRHAKSSWDDSRMDDFERPLNERGRDAAQAVGRELQRRAVRFDQVIASPAVRVRETLDQLARGYGALPDVRFDPQIYGGDLQALEGLLRGLPDAVRSPLLVGHNPGFHELVLALTGRAENGLRERVRGKFPTAAVAFIQLPAQRWMDVARGSGRIDELILPRELAD